jgi:hypothetical protein
MMRFTGQKTQDGTGYPSQLHLPEQGVKEKREQVQ